MIHFLKCVKRLGYFTVMVCNSVMFISTYEIMEKIQNIVSGSTTTGSVFVVGLVGVFLYVCRPKMNASPYLNPLKNQN